MEFTFAESGFSIEGGVPGEAARRSPVDLILDLAEEVPYNVQMLAHACWAELKETGRPTLTGEAVGAALERLARQYDPFYTQLWNPLTPIQKKVLVAVIREGGRNLLSTKVTREIGKGPGTVRRALQAMRSRDFLREEEGAGSIRMRFEDPLFATWIGMFAAR